jgi:hypothetical protein
LDCANSLGSWPDVLALAVCIAAVAVFALRLRSLRGLFSSAFLSLSALVFAFAAGQPLLVQSAFPMAAAGHVVAVVDLSDSVWRDEAVASSAMNRLADRAAEMATSLEGDGWTGQVLGFAEGVVPGGAALPLERLPDLIRALPTRPGQDGSRVESGLATALDQIREAGGRGAILLLSDGLFRPEVSEPIFDRAASMGVSISVLPTGSDSPAKGLIAADLGPEQQIGSQATVRGTVLGGGTLSAQNGQQESEIDVPNVE